MRISISLLCCLAFGLTGCAPATPDHDFRSREERPYPSPTLGTENSESQWYRTQTIAPPSPAAVTAAANAPAKLAKTPVPARRVAPHASTPVTPSAGASAITPSAAK